jgi:hypothetical protein
MNSFNMLPFFKYVIFIVIVIVLKSQVRYHLAMTTQCYDMSNNSVCPIIQISDT